MEERTLTEYLEAHAEPAPDGSAPQPWYNQFGDCIDYQTQRVAVVADRIDHHLTILRSAENNEAIGFQLKDVKALMKKYKSQFGIVFSTHNERLISVTSLLLTAFQIDAPSTATMKKRAGYEQAIRSFSSKDEVSLA